ncbi:MAG: hypothetical protein WC934_02900 [Acidithiobacillus sp.]|jgi:hypothetical protein|uniref:hypothetical protein n=1 Tax=Acidithiobacillus sp. TaxID=1872118 RepID=UPI0035602C7C
MDKKSYKQCLDEKKPHGKNYHQHQKQCGTKQSDQDIKIKNIRNDGKEKIKKECLKNKELFENDYFPNEINLQLNNIEQTLSNLGPNDDVHRNRLNKNKMILQNQLKVYNDLHEVCKEFL